MDDKEYEIFNPKEFPKVLGFTGDGHSIVGKLIIEEDGTLRFEGDKVEESAKVLFDIVIQMWEGRRKQEC